MKGDITRLTFDPKKHYTSVRMQQGRLQLDADWNEQVDIDNHLRRAQILASLGSENGVPIYNPETQESESNSFKLTIIDQGKDIQITPGHLYISGTLCELELGTPFDATIKDSQPEKLQLEVSSLVIDGREIQKNQWLEDIEKGEQYQIETVDRQKRTLTLITTGKTDKKTIKLRRLSTYTTQPDYLNPPTRNTSNPSNTNLKPGFYLAYIDVWERHITTIEDNSLREIALNSPDTTTRTKTVWQLKLLNIQEAAEKQLLNFVKQIEVIDNKKEAKTKLIDELKGLIKSQKQITEADFKNKFNELTKTNQQRKFTELLTQYNNNVSQEGAEKLRDFVNAIEVTTQDKKDAKNKLVNELAKLIKSQENITEEKRSSFENEFNELTKSDEQRRFTELLTQYNDNVRLEKAEKLIDFVKKIEVTEDKKDAHTKLIDELKVFIKSQKQITEEKRSSFKNKFNELTKTDKQKEFTELLTQYKNNISQEGAEKLREFVNEIEVTTEDKKDAKNKLIDELTKLIESQEKITEEKLSSFKNKFNELTKTNQQRKFTELLTQYNDNISQERDELEENSDKIWKEFVGNNNNRFTEAKMNACALLCDNSITGYQRLENQLYRVEIHQSGIIGDDTSPTFKWSRENGSIASPIVGKIEGNTINIQPSSNDAWSSSQPGQQWIEMTSEEQELKGIPGVLAPINRVISGTKIEFGNPTNTNGENLTKVRRWDSNEIEIKSPEWIDLEGGIKVKFSSKLAYETGDYWLIPARTATNDIEWPNDNGEPAKPIPQLPRGIRHDYARLGLVKINEEGGFEGPEQEGEILDKRIIFPSLQNSFDKVNGGDITGNVTIKAKLGVTGKVTITDTLDVDNSTNLATQKGNVAIGSDSHQAELGVTGKVTITDTLDVDNSTNLATQKGNVAIGSKANEAELGVTGNVTITDTLDVDNSTNLATQKGNVAIGIQQSEIKAKLHTKSSGWYPEDSTQWPKITKTLNPENTQIEVNDATGLDKGVLLKIKGVLELRRVTDIDDTTLTITPGLQESIENENEQLSFQYQQPIARFDSQLNGQVENQLTVVGDGTVLAKDIKANTLEVGELFLTALQTDTLDVDKSANLAINEGNVAIGIQQSEIKAKLHTKSSGWFPEDLNLRPKITKTLNPENTQIEVNDGTGLDKGVLLKIKGVLELRRVTDIDDTTLTITPGLKESIENESEQLSFQYQQPIARFDSQLNGQVENQLTVVGDGTVLAKDIKAETLEVGELFLTALQTDTLDVDKSTNLAINEGNVAIGIQQSEIKAKLHTKSSGWFPEDLNLRPKITKTLNPENTQIEVNDGTGLDKGVLLKIKGVLELRRVTDIDDTTLTITPGLKESIENESEQLSFQYQQPIARFDSQLNGQVENQLTVVGDGTVLAKDIKANTLEVGELFSIVLPTGETEPSEWTRQEIQTILNSLKTIKISDNNAGFNLEGISEVLTYSDGKAIKILDVVAIITEAIKQNRQVIVELNNKIERQKTRINTAEIANLTTRIKALEDQNLETEITSLRTRIDILDALEEGDLETEIAELKTEIAILEEEKLEEKITDVKTRIEALDPLDEENLETKIAELKTEIDSLEQQKVEIAGFKKRIEALERQNLQATIAKLTEKIEALERQNPEETLEAENPGGA